MLNALAVGNYRSLLNLVVPLGALNVITGPNGSGKSNLYRALRLLAETADTGVVSALAREGGLQSSFWAGPEKISAGMRGDRVAMSSDEVPIQGGPRRDAVRLRLGFAGEDFGYAISLGLPTPSASAFALDPEIKRECIWAGPVYRPASLLVDRKGPMIKVRSGREWVVIDSHLGLFDSMFRQMADPNATPEVLRMRELIRGWRFYDHFRTDRDAPARQPQLGTRTPVLHHDGRDLAAALQTIREIGDPEALERAIGDAFPGARLDVVVGKDGRFALEFHQHGLLRPLSGSELSDGTLRYLLWIAALLTPRPAGAHRVERTGDESASGPAACVGAVDRRGGAAHAGVGRVARKPPDRRAQRTCGVPLDRARKGPWSNARGGAGHARRTGVALA